MKRMRLCRETGCRNISEESYCKQHRNQPRRNHVGSTGASKKFLDSAAWKSLRLIKLNESPCCEACLAATGRAIPAIDVDHVIPRDARPDLALDIKNLQSLCKTCHGKKTRSENLA